jgi:membrane-bound lytic murein transglycosylase C
MIKKILLSSAFVSLLLAQSASQYQAQQMKEFEKHKTHFGKYKTSVEEEFAKYSKEQQKAFREYKRELGVFWDKPKLSTKKTWVAYTEDKKTRTDVDFKNSKITVETIATSKEDAKEKLRIALAKVVTINTKTAQESDPLEKKLAQIKKPADVVISEIKPEPILSTVIFDKEPSVKKVVKFVKKHTKDRDIKSVKSQKVKHARVYSISVALPKDTMLKRSKIYYKEVKKQASRQQLPIPLVFAVMHTESSFNPRARSHVPAYGLMQIVPKTAGIDTYKYLYNKKRLVSGTYLYDSTNNITMGSGYLHILYYKYLRKIKDPDSRLYCTIAAYNTGAGNIAWAFTRTYNMNKAAPIINRLTPQQVYNRLLRDLRYDEPKHYLKRVSKRMAAYHKIYGS